MRATLVSTSPVVCTFVTLPPCTHSQMITAALPTITIATSAAAAFRRRRSPARACARAGALSSATSVIGSA